MEAGAFDRKRLRLFEAKTMPFDRETLGLFEGKTHAVFQTVEAGAVRRR